MNDLAFDLLPAIGVGFPFGCALAILVTGGSSRVRASAPSGSPNRDAGRGGSSYRHCRLGKVGDLLSEWIRTMSVNDIIGYSRDGEVADYAYDQEY